MLARILRPLLLGASILTLQADTFSTYFQMEQARKAGEKEEAYQLNLQLIDESKAQRIHHYTFVGYYRLAYQSYLDGRYDDCLAQTTAGIQIFEDNKANRNFTSPWYPSSYLSMWELSERCHTAQMRPGEGWRAQQKATELWHQLVSLPYQAGHFDVQAIARLSPENRGRGWRQISREASYLHEVGRTTEARNLLRAAIAQINKAHSRPVFYEAHLLDSLGIIESFIGYKENAIAISQQQIQKIRQIGSPGKDHSILGARLNLAINRAGFEGSTEEVLLEARALHDQVAALDPRIAVGFQRQIVRLESILSTHNKTPEELEELAAQALENGDDLEAFYLNRNALFTRAQSTHENLDSHFKELLANVRQSGKKRSEPRVYRHYGDWLGSQQRYGEALTVYHEALSLTRTFEWHPMVPILLPTRRTGASRQRNLAPNGGLPQSPSRYSHPNGPQGKSIPTRHLPSRRTRPRRQHLA